MARVSLPVLGGYSKAAPGTVNLNYCRSDGKYCDAGCSHHHECYGVRTERFRGELAAKLDRHEVTDPAELTDRARAELERRIASGQRPPWFRFASEGAMPPNPDRRLTRSIRRLLDVCNAAGIPVHLPAETADKAADYRRVAGGRAVVRESCHTRERWLSAPGAVSIVGGYGPPRLAGVINGKAAFTRERLTRRERIDQCKELAAARRQATGRKCIVCPATAAWYLTGKHGERAHCGYCTACAEPDVDVVYPLT